jgi:peptidoglycan hydrolase-like protein with peptidoglycan-binding domain
MKRAAASLVSAVAILTPAILPVAREAAHAQTPPAAKEAADAALASQKAAFLALPETTRKAAQDALVWLGFYNGVVDGDFGQRTRDAILAFQASLKAPADGALSTADLQALLASAQKAREAAGFQVVSDAATGARIGAPTRLLAARPGAKLDFASSADPDLSALYARLSAATPTRKIAYKAMKPDAFFVVSGQYGGTRFYTRFDKNEAANPPIRGFTFAYPVSKAAELDRIALAVANSFEPFPQPSAEPAKAAPGGAAAVAGEASPAVAANPEPAATALVIAPGKALTALNAADCPNPVVDGKPVRFERTDAATGLTIIAGDFDANAEAPRFGSLGPDLVVFGFAGPRVAISAASLAGDQARPLAVAAIEASAGGGPVFDRRGALVGVVAPFADQPKRISGVALAAPHPIIAPGVIRAFLGGGEAAPESSPPLSAGDIAAREKNALMAVYCGG